MSKQLYSAQIIECNNGHTTLFSEYGLGFGEFDQVYNSTPDECKSCRKEICP